MKEHISIFSGKSLSGFTIQISSLLQSERTEVQKVLQHQEQKERHIKGNWSSHRIKVYHTRGASIISC